LSYGTVVGALIRHQLKKVFMNNYYIDFCYKNQ